MNLLQTLSTLGNAGAVANARRGAEVQHRHELAALELRMRLDAHDRAVAAGSDATRPSAAGGSAAAA